MHSWKRWKTLIPRYTSKLWRSLKSFLPAPSSDGLLARIWSFYSRDPPARSRRRRSGLPLPLYSFASASFRMEHQRREDELKNRSSKKAQEAEQANLNMATSPQTGSQQGGGSFKSSKDKSKETEKDGKEGSSLQTAGPGGEITAENMAEIKKFVHFA